MKEVLRAVVVVRLGPPDPDRVPVELQAPVAPVAPVPTMPSVVTTAVPVAVAAAMAAAVVTTVTAAMPSVVSTAVAVSVTVAVPAASSRHPQAWRGGWGSRRRGPRQRRGEREGVETEGGGEGNWRAAAAGSPHRYIIAGRA